MGRPKRQQPYDPNKVHDRRATDLLRNAQVAVIEVDDPYEPGAKIATVRSIRGDPLGALHSRRSISESQYHAGRAFQADFETCERPAQAIDPSKPYVDCSSNPQPLSDSFSKALVRLNLAHRELGQIGSALTHDVLIAAKSYSKVAADRGYSGRTWEEYFGIRFREALDTLAVVYGFAMKGR